GTPHVSHDPKMSNGRRVFSSRFGIESTAPHRPGSGHLRRAFALLPVAAILACLQSTPAAAQNLPGPSANFQTIKAGPLVIPMDAAHQGTPAPFNMKAYGLANYLLQHNVPLKRAIRAGKSKDAIDFTATA